VLCEPWIPFLEDKLTKRAFNRNLRTSKSPTAAGGSGAHSLTDRRKTYGRPPQPAEIVLRSYGAVVKLTYFFPRYSFAVSPSMTIFRGCGRVSLSSTLTSATRSSSPDTLRM